jgi:hypothetical protein
MPEHWLKQAQQMREMAEKVSLPSDKCTLLKMAEDYYRQAVKAAVDWVWHENQMNRPTYGGKSRLP